MTTPAQPVPQPNPTASGNNSTADNTASDIYYIARHNNTIIGIFDNQNDAQDAINGYTMSKNTSIDDTLEIWSGSPVS